MEARLDPLGACRRLSRPSRGGTVPTGVLDVPRHDPGSVAAQLQHSRRDVALHPADGDQHVLYVLKMVLLVGLRSLLRHAENLSETL